MRWQRRNNLCPCLESNGDRPFSKHVKTLTHISPIYVTMQQEQTVTRYDLHTTVVSIRQLRRMLNWISNALLPPPPAHNYETVRWIVTTHILEHHGVAYMRFCRKCERPLGTEYENIWGSRGRFRKSRRQFDVHTWLSLHETGRKTLFSSLSFRLYVHHIPRPPTDIWMKLEYIANWIKTYQ
jgi:hypothetical protein